MYPTINDKKINWYVNNNFIRDLCADNFSILKYLIKQTNIQWEWEKELDELGDDSGHKLEISLIIHLDKLSFKISFWIQTRNLDCTSIYSDCFGDTSSFDYLIPPIFRCYGDKILLLFESDVDCHGVDPLILKCYYQYL